MCAKEGTNQTIGEMMEHYAREAVSLAHEDHINLDYSEGSLRQVEELFDRFDLKGKDAEIDTLCRLWGGYLGEVVRRHWGGEWTIEKYPAGDFLVVTLNVNGSKIYPAMKIDRRLSKGKSEDVCLFYEMLKPRLVASKSGGTANS